MKLLLLGSAALLVSLSAGAAPEFHFNQEFFSVCDEKALTSENVQAQFEALSWDEVSDEGIAAFLTPDDVLSEIEVTYTYEVDLEDGSAWYGAFSTGTLGQGSKVNYCQLLLVTDDLTEWKDDFQGALTFGKPIQEGDDPTDKRWVWIDAANLDDSTGGYVFREVSAEDMSYVTAARYWFK